MWKPSIREIRTFCKVIDLQSLSFKHFVVFNKIDLKLDDKSVGILSVGITAWWFSKMEFVKLFYTQIKKQNYVDTMLSSGQVCFWNKPELLIDFGEQIEWASQIPQVSAGYPFMEDFTCEIVTGLEASPSKIPKVPSNSSHAFLRSWL